MSTICKSNPLTFIYGMLVCLVACPLWGQELKQRTLQQSDYVLWGNLGHEQISEKGNWISFAMNYPSGLDTLFVKNVNTNTLYRYTGAADSGHFLSDDIFAFKKGEDLITIQLVNGKEFIIPKVTSFKYVAKQKLIISLEGENSNTVVLRKGNKMLLEIKDVLEYKLNDAQDQMCLSTLKEGVATVELIVLNNLLEQKQIQSAVNRTFKSLNWQPSGSSFVFYGEDSANDNAVYLYNSDSGKVSVLKSSDHHFPKERAITTNPNLNLYISHDGEKVFFGMTSKVPKDTTDYFKGEAIWNAADKRYYPSRKKMGKTAFSNHTAVWFPKDTIVREVGTDQHPRIAFNGNQDFALVADPFAYAPFYKWIGDVDYYLLHLKTGIKELLFKEQSGYENHMNFSPDGRYISYYKKGDWWLYNLQQRSAINGTKGMNVIWDNRVTDPGNELRVWGQAGWSKDGKFALFYDSHDLWKVSTDGLIRERLTNGKELNRKYRLDAVSLLPFTFSNHELKQKYRYDLTSDLVMQLVDLNTGNTGYCMLTPDKKIHAWLDEAFAFNGIKKASKDTRVVYRKERFDCPPALYINELKGNQQKLMYQSNAHYKKFQHGTSKLIDYTDSKGNALKGVLFYPANYETGKKYPMVVYIYESLSHSLHEYVNPSLLNGIGFNSSNLTSKGYAVLMPDIMYEKGNSGISATDCVVAATTKVISMGVADATKIGLMGHSFGGYETNFIITNTPIFATAISGASVANTVDHYFTFNTIYNSIDGWRYENQQYRMGFSFFENKDAYYRNSPLHNAANITTPLLTWAGALDLNVLPNQASSFYAALRRLNKEHVMLVYPDEGHIFYNPRNQENLTRKIEDWMDYYLKGILKPEWMLSDREQGK